METSAGSREQPQSQHSGWGGKRAGAGRRPGDRWFKARGLKPATVTEILERADERRIWHRLLNSRDEAIVLRAVTYLTDRRDGRAAQQINVTQFGLTVSASDVAKARELVRQLAPPGLVPSSHRLESEARLRGDSPMTLEAECR